MAHDRELEEVPGLGIDVGADVQQDRPAAAELDESAPLCLAEHAVDRRAGRARERSELLLDQRDHDGRRTSVDARKLEHAPNDPGLRVDGVRLDEALGEEPHVLREHPHEHLTDRRMRTGEPPELRAAQDERLAGLERAHRRAPLGAGDDRNLAERLPRAADRERHDVPVGRRDPDVEAPLDDEVHRVGRVAVVEDDLAAPIGAASREREHGAHVLAGYALEEPPFHVCDKRYTPGVAAERDGRLADS